jgi:hypothetical protein
VLTAIDLDNERVVGANEIHDKVTQRDLAAEFQSEQAAVAQARPLPLLDLGLVCARAPRLGSSHAPS